MKTYNIIDIYKCIVVESQSEFNSALTWLKDYNYIIIQKRGDITDEFLEELAEKYYQFHVLVLDSFVGYIEIDRVRRREQGQ